MIHLDPVEMTDEHVLSVKKQVRRILDALDSEVSIHDFRMVDGTDQINLIFDMVVPFEYDDKRKNELRTSLMKLLKIADERYECVITVERSYIGNAQE